MDTHSRHDPVEELYDARIRGVCLISTRDGRRTHLHGGCWVTACAHAPARLLVAFPQEFEGAEIVRSGGRFAVSLVADDQWAFCDALFAGNYSLDALGRDRFLRAARVGVGPPRCAATARRPTRRRVGKPARGAVMRPAGSRGESLALKEESDR